MKINGEELEQLIRDGYVNRQKHPTADLWVLCYSNKTQYERMWTDLTMMCRGLIIDQDYNIVSRPLRKFFNASEVTDIPNLPFTVYEKYDGSLGTTYWLNGMPHIATKGSFTSPQALKATQILHKKYRHLHHLMSSDLTYCFEIIFPENRVCVDYQDWEEIILLAVIHIDGYEIPLPHMGFPIAKDYPQLSMYPWKDWATMRTAICDNQEGFVVKFSDGTRLKIKSEEYLRLHSILTNTTSYDIWEALKEGMMTEELLERVPDEFYDFVKRVRDDLFAKLLVIKSQVLHDHMSLPLGDRKKIAEVVKTKKYPHLLFAMLDGKDLEYLIWQQIKPKFEKPFSNEYKDQQGTSGLPV